MRFFRLFATLTFVFLATACGNTPVPAVPTIITLPQATRPATGPGVAVQTATPAEQVCEIPAAATFAALLSSAPGVSQKVRCPVAEAVATPGTEEYFQRGYMLWRRDLRRIYVLQMNGSWQTFADTWTEDQPQDDPTLTPPPNTLQPVRGFGKVWRENSDVKEAVGWATRPEEGLMAAIQQFEGGMLLYTDGDRIRVLYSDGAWQEFPAPKPGSEGTGAAPGAYPAETKQPGGAAGAYPAVPETQPAPTAYP